MYHLHFCNNDNNNNQQQQQEEESIVSTSDWIKGISFSILANIIGGASKLMIRKSWLLEQQQQQHVPLTTTITRTAAAATTTGTDSNMIVHSINHDTNSNGRYSHIVNEDNNDDTNDLMVEHSSNNYDSIIRPMTHRYETSDNNYQSCFDYY
jgi:hypothetical protein